MEGVDLGIALRQRNLNLGIVIHVQYPLHFATERVPAAGLFSWSTLQPSGQLNLDELSQLLKLTALSVGRLTYLLDDLDAETAKLVRAPGHDRFTTRQWSIMGLAATAFSAPRITVHLPEMIEGQLPCKSFHDLETAAAVLVDLFNHHGPLKCGDNLAPVEGEKAHNACHEDAGALGPSTYKVSGLARRFR